MEDRVMKVLEDFETEYGRLPARLREKLLEVLSRDTPQRRHSGLTLLALRAFPSSPVQVLFQTLRNKEIH